MKSLITVSVFLLLLTGCGITIVPRPLTPADRVNTSDQSITINRDQVSISARVQDTAVGGFSLDRPLASFYVVAVNNSRKDLLLPGASFTLTDNNGDSYQALNPADVSTLLAPDSDFLIPFPFISFLDVTDREIQRASSATASEQPYAGQGMEQENPAGAPFPDSSLSPGSRSAGMVFFAVDLYNLNSVRLQIVDAKSKKAYTFPFAIEK